MQNFMCPDLRELIAARAPLVYLQSKDEGRGIRAVEDALSDFKCKVRWWSLSEGLDRSGEPDDPDEILTLIKEKAFADTKKLQIFGLLDFHPYLNPLVIRKVKDLYRDLKNTRTSVVFLSNMLEIPDELAQIIELVELPLPDRSDVAAIIEDTCDTKKTKVSDAGLVDACLGMTEDQIKTAIRRSIAVHRKPTIKKILKCKADTVKRSGTLELIQPEITLDDVGGMGEATKWVNKRRIVFTDPKAKEFGLRSSKGILVIGIPGCGKSHFIKAVIGSYGVTGLKFDVGRVFGSLVGESEKNMREALATAEAVKPAILWMDEFEKMFASLGGRGGGDAGTGARVGASFLTWMQEKTSDVMVMATANDISMLPPELLRRGRWDEIFFVDLPNFQERMEILSVHILLKGRDPANFDLEELAQHSEAYVGSELESAIEDGLFHAYGNKRDLRTEDVRKALVEMVPLSETMKEKIQALRAWAEGRARRASLPANNKAVSLGEEAVLDLSDTPAGVGLDIITKESRKASKTKAN
jgi:SpoVK/Ycf46/Vps4 family AAA+-type ATPase